MSRLDSPYFTSQMVEPRMRLARLAAREVLSPSYVRVRLEGPELEGFGGGGVDDHVRLFFPTGDDLSVEGLRAGPSREFTPLTWGGSGESSWVELEFVVHGSEGVAGVWAATAPIGAPLGIAGPRGSRVVTEQPGAWILLGDESALAQLRRYRAAATTPTLTVLEVEDESCELPAQEFERDGANAVRHVHRRGGAPGSALIEALATLDLPPQLSERPFVFIAGESSVVPAGRALVRELGLGDGEFLVKGYWRAGLNDEEKRARAKAEREAAEKAQAAEDDAAQAKDGGAALA